MGSGIKSEVFFICSSAGKDGAESWTISQRALLSVACVPSAAVFYLLAGVWEAIIRSEP